MILKKIVTNKGFIAFISFFLLIACNSSENDIDAIASTEIFPENLNISVSIIGVNANNLNGDGSGKIEVTVSALNASSYIFKFGDGKEITNTSGITEHTYNSEGLNSYTIEVFAISNTGNSIGDFKKIDVFVLKNGTTLIWSEEFNINGAPNPDNWGFDIGTGNNGWGNGESQYYTNRTDNVVVENGVLKITAKKESFQGAQYTSSRLLSKGKFDFTYGRVEVRAKLPEGKGTWPAIWMLGCDDAGGSLVWPKIGEIDIMEYLGDEPTTVFGTIHGPGFSGANSITKKYDLLNDRFDTGFHVFGVEWTPNQINWYVDGDLYQSITPADVSEETNGVGEWVFNRPYIILNVAVAW
ncbi:UNVERIFIED_CONTAM: hypothetical protein GTU68_023909 [Idotea baltica]|nr:hypothetical protein [Idotea baltica]